MFENCHTLSELNMERSQLSQTMDIVTVNNAYNQARARILEARNNFTQVRPVFVTIPEPVQYSGIPIAGRSDEVNTIKLTRAGFLY